MEADGSYFVLSPAGDRQPVEFKEQRSEVGRFGSFVNEATLPTVILLTVGNDWILMFSL